MATPDVAVAKLKAAAAAAMDLRSMLAVRR
jgi:hypothetical protein